MMDWPTEVGKRLTSRRTELGLSRRKVADAVGLHHTTVVRIEKGAQGLRLEQVVPYCKALNIDPVEFISVLIELDLSQRHAIKEKP